MSALAIALGQWFMRGGWKFAAGIGLALALFFALLHYGSTRYAAGVTHERAAWQAIVAKQAAAATTLAQERDAAVARAMTAEADAQRSLDAASTRTRNQTAEYYRAHPAANVNCLSADRLRNIAASDAAAQASARTARGSATALRDTAGHAR